MSIEDIINEEYQLGLTDTLEFGQYKGRKISLILDLDYEYLGYLMKKKIIDVNYEVKEVYELHKKRDEEESSTFSKELEPQDGDLPF